MTPDEELRALRAENTRLREALIDLMQYVGGWDAPEDHPCGQAVALLKELGEV